MVVGEFEPRIPSFSDAEADDKTMDSTSFLDHQRNPSPEHIPVEALASVPSPRPASRVRFDVPAPARSLTIPAVPLPPNVPVARRPPIVSNFTGQRPRPASAPRDELEGVRFTHFKRKRSFFDPPVRAKRPAINPDSYDGDGEDEDDAGAHPGTSDPPAPSNKTNTDGPPSRKGSYTNLGDEALVLASQTLPQRGLALQTGAMMQKRIWASWAGTPVSPPANVAITSSARENSKTQTPASAAVSVISSPKVLAGPLPAPKFEIPLEPASGADTQQDNPIDQAPHGLSTLPIHSANIESSATISTSMAIGKQTPTEDVVSSLVTHGCKDLTRAIDLATFGNYPVSEGGFGDIYRGSMLDGTHVAIQTLRIFVGATNQNTKALKHAAKELHTWSKCKHPNVLELLGLAVFRDRIGMVAPWVDNGNISRYLERVSDVDRCRLCIQICDGLSYLHDIGVIHGDLKGTNVLISGDGTTLLTDFGNSVLAERTLQFTQTTEKSSMTMRWSAPELITGSDTYSKAADVYALGMTLLETIAGMPPYHGKPERSIMYTVVVKRELPGRPEEHIPTNSKDGNKLWDLLVSCWSFEPEERPSASVVAQTMGTVTQEGLTPAESLQSR